LGKGEVKLMATEKASKKYGEFDEWEVKDWSQTLERAAEIMSDKKKMAAVAKCMESKKKAIKTLQDMRDYANARDE
jgi:hypothetical protein